MEAVEAVERSAETRESLSVDRRVVREVRLRYIRHLPPYWRGFDRGNEGINGEAHSAACFFAPESVS